MPLRRIGRTELGELDAQCHDKLREIAETVFYALVDRERALNRPLTQAEILQASTPILTAFFGLGIEEIDILRDPDVASRIVVHIPVEVAEHLRALADAGQSGNAPPRDRETG